MSVDISLLNRKKALLNSMSLKGNEIEFTKDINSDSITCAKLICDDIEINNSGETEIDNALITNSKIDNTTIGITTPAKGIFNKFQLKTSGSLNTSFIIDSDITISNLKFTDQERTINSINPLKLFSNQYLSFDTNQYILVNSAGYINLSSRADINLSTSKNIVFNSNNLDIKSPSFNIYGRTIFNNISDSSDFISSSIISKGGIAIYKNLNIQGHIISNNSIDTTNINNGSLILKGGASIQKNIIIGKDINIFGKSFIYNSTNSSDLYTGSSINYGGSVIKKNCYIGGNVNFIDNHDSNAFNIFSKSYFNNTVNVNSDIIIQGLANFNNLTVQNNLNSHGNSNIYNLNIDNNLIINSNHNSFITQGNISTFKNFNIQGKIFSNNSNQDALTLQGGAIINKNLIVHKNLTIFSNSNNSLNLYGDALFYNNLNIQNSLTVDKNVNIKNNTVLNNTTINGITNINNSLFIANNLNVSKNTIIQNNLQVSNNITTNNIFINNNLDVVNNINSNNLLIKKNITVNNDLLILGNSHLHNNTNTYNLFSINHFTNNINTDYIKSTDVVCNNINTNYIKTIDLICNNINTEYISINVSISNQANINTLHSTNISSNTITSYNTDILNNLNIYNNLKLHNPNKTGLDINSDALIRGSLYINGDFNIGGETSLISTTNTVIKDNIFGINHGIINNVYDSGFSIDRGLAGPNAIFFWNELNNKFILGTTNNNNESLFIQDYQLSTLNSNILSDNINTQILSVASDTTLYNNLNIFANTKLYSKSTFYNSSYFNNNVYISNNSDIGFYINSNTNFNANSIFYNTTHFHKPTTFHNNSLLNIFSNSNFYGNINVDNNNINIHSNNININNNNTNISSNTTFYKNTFFKNTLYIENNNTNKQHIGLIVNSNSNFNKSLYLYDKSYFLNDLIIGNNSNNNIIFNSKFSNFKMINGLSFQNNSNNLYLSNINTIYFNSNTNTLQSSIINKDLIVKNQSIFYNNVLIGYNNNSLVTFNSKLSDFTMKNGAQFNNTSTYLTIKHNNIFINSNLSTNKFTVKDKLNVLNESTFHNNINIISNNSNSSFFIIFNNQNYIQNNQNSLQIKHNNVYINSNNTTTNSLQIKNNLSVKQDTFLLNNITCGSSFNNIINFNSKLSDFKMKNGTQFTNTSGLLTITETNTFLDTDLTTNSITVNNDTILNGITTLNNNVIFGTSNSSNNITFNSKLSDFIMHNGSQFTNTTDTLTITETNTFLDTDLTTNSITVNNDTTLNGNITFGSNSSNNITFNSKLSDFIMHNGSQFTNTTDTLTITETNTFLDTDLTTNSITVNNDTTLNGNITFGSSNSSNIITFNSKLDNFTMKNGALFTNTIGTLTIKEINTFLDTNLSTNYINTDSLIVNNTTNLNGDVIFGISNSTNNIIFNSKLDDFTMKNNAKFIDDVNNLTIQKQLTTFDGNVLLNYLDIEDNLLVKNQTTFQGNVYIGINDSNNVFFNSKLSDFTMHNGSQFTNTSGLLTITETNTFLDTDLTTNSLIVNNNTNLNGDVIFGVSNSSHNITFNSKLDDFIMKNGASISNNDNSLTISNNNTTLSISNNTTTINNSLITENLNVNNNLLVNNNIILNGSIIYGSSGSSGTSTLGNFTMHNGAEFINTFDTLTITEGNIVLNSNLNTNSLTVNNTTNLNGDVIFGVLNSSNLITFNSKLDDFTMKNGTQFTNTSGSLTITETNTFLDTDLTTNSIIVNNDTTLKGTTTLDGITDLNGDVTVGVTNSSNLITFNSKLSDFTMHNGTQFTNTTGSLTITENNITLDSNLNINYLSTFNNDIICGSNSSYLITFNSKLSNFTMHQGAHFTNTSGLLTINETNTFLNTNLTTNDLTINNHLIVNKTSTFNDDLILGVNNSNIITINSKVSDFTLLYGATIKNISNNTLQLKEDSILLDGDTTVNSNLNILNNANIYGSLDVSKNINVKNINVSKDLLVNGDLFINGKTTIVDTENMSILDNIIELNSGATTNLNDTGILINRGNSYPNAFIGWKEQSQKFILGSTTNNSSTTGSININTGSLLANIEGNIQAYNLNVSNNTILNDTLLVKKEATFKNNVTIGTTNHDNLILNSKLSDFSMHQGAKFINTSNLLTIEQNYTTFQGDLSATNINVDNNLFVNNTSTFYNDVTFGNTNSNNIITFNSKLSNFTMHQGAQFSNTSGILTINEINTFLDTNLTTNDLTINNHLNINKNIILSGDATFGTNHSNIITFNSKLSNFTMHQGAQFSNTSGTLTINETNTFLDTNLTTNNLTVNNISSFNNDIICGSSSNNLITFNSKLSNFTMHQGTQFSNTSGLLTIKETNTFLDTNLTTNDLTINNHLTVNKTSTFNNNIYFGPQAKLSNFTMNNNAQFIDTTNDLTIKKNNFIIDGNTVLNNTNINHDLIVKKISYFYDDVFIGSTNNNFITFNSKLSNFTMNNNSTFVDTNNLLTITQNNIYLKSNLNTNTLFINNNLNVLENTYLLGNNILGTNHNNITTIKSKLDDFTMKNNALFQDNIDSLQITKNNINILSNTTLQKTTVNDIFITNNNVFLNKDVFIGYNLNTSLTIKSKLNNFTMNHNSTFNDDNDLLTITQNNIHLNSNVSSNSLLVLNNININGNTIIGSSLNNILTVNSKISDFTMSNNAQFINNNNHLIIKNNNILLDANTTTNNAFINNDLYIFNNSIIGTNHNNITTIKSKLADFTMTNGAQIKNTPTNLTISNNNIYINSNITNTNELNVNNNLNVIQNLNLYKNLIFYNNNSIYNAILQNFSTINQTKFINKHNELIITQKNIHLNTNLSTNSFIVYNNSTLKQNVSLGSTDNHFINILGKVSDFKMNNNTQFQNYDNNTLKITQNNIILNSNLNILNNTTIDENLYVQKNTYLNNDIYLGNNNNNTIQFNALLSDFYTLNNTHFYNYNSNTLQVTQDNIILNSNLDIKNNTLLHKNLTILGNANFKNNTLLHKNLTILGNTNFKNNIIIGNSDLNTVHFKSKLSDFKMNNNASFINNINTLEITNKHITFNSNTTVNNNLNVNQNINVSDTLNVYNNVYVSNTLNITKNANFSSNIHVVNNINTKNINISDNITTSTISISQNINTHNLIVSNILQAYIGSPTNNFDDLIGNIDLNHDLLIPDAFQKIDYWINYYLIDTPPPPTLVSSDTTPYYIDLVWNNPSQIYLAFLNQQVPYINSIAVDYKLSQDNWTEYTTVVFNSPNITKLRIQPMESTNYIDDTTFNLFNILNQTFYDFRIYCINNNKNRPSKYLYINNLKTTNISYPSPVNDFIVTNNINNSLSSFNISWNKPTFTNDLDTIDNNLNIKQYNINIIPVQTKKYNSQFMYSNINITINSNSIFNNPINNHTIQNLYPGHTYALKIKSRNHIFSDFSDYSYPPIIKNTDYPISPNFINNNNININNSTNYYFNNQTSQSFAYDLNNNIINNLYDYDLLDDTFQTNIIDDIRINENISSTETTSSIISMNLNNSFYNINLAGFSYTNHSNNYFDDLNIKLYNQKDYYSDIYNSGFYKTLDFNVVFNSNKLFTPSTKKNTLSFNQILNYNSNIYNTKSHSFYVDKLYQPIISNLNINSIYNHNVDYISGVPIFTDIKFNVNFITHNLTNNFYRYDKKLFDLTLSDTSYKTYENINISHDYIVNNSNYYNINNTLHNNGKFISPNTSSLLFKNFIIDLKNNHNQGYTENLNITTNIYNLKYITQNIFHFNNNIRVDYDSLNSKNILNNSNSNYGLLTHSGVNQDFVYLPNSTFNQIHYDNFDIFNNFLLPNSNIVNQYSNFISYNNQNITIDKTNNNALFVHDFYINYNSSLTNVVNINNIHYNYNIPLQYSNIFTDIGQINYNNVNHYKNLFTNLDCYNISDTNYNTDLSTTIHYIYYVLFNNDKFEFYSDSNYTNLLPFNTLSFTTTLKYRFYQTHHSNKNRLLAFSTANTTSSLYPNVKYNSSPSFFNSYIEIEILPDFNDIYIYYNFENGFDSGSNYNPIQTNLITEENTFEPIQSDLYTKKIHINNNIFSLQYNNAFVEQLENIYSTNYNSISNIINTQDKLVSNMLDFSLKYNHNKSLTTNYSLQLLNGYFVTNNYNNSYNNYNNYYLPNLYPDYSTISDNFRYSTFKYTSLDLTTNRLTLEIIDTNIDLLDTSDIKLYIKIYDNNNYETSWFNCSKFINMIGLSKFSKNGAGCLSKLNPVSEPTKRYIYLPRYSTGNILVRIGLKMNSPYYFKYIKLIQGFI